MQVLELGGAYGGIGSADRSVRYDTDGIDHTKKKSAKQKAPDTLHARLDRGGIISR